MSSEARQPLVVFDFDGTLADTWRDIATALNRTLADAGLPRVEGPQVRFWIGQGVIHLLEQAVPGVGRDEKAVHELYMRFREHYEVCCLDTTDTYPGIMECLAELSDARLAIASNKPAYFLDRILDGLGLKGYFRVTVGGDSLGVRKPDPGVIEHVRSRIDGTPSSVWMIGDSAIDVGTGQASQAGTIGCAWGLRGRQELEEANVEWLIEHPREIPRIVYGRT